MQVSHFSKRACLVVGIFLAAGSAFGPAFGKDKDAASANALNPVDYPVCAGLPGDASDFICHCPSGFTQGSVWGSGPYTGDSNICTAAQHSGLIGAGATLLSVTQHGALDVFSGSQAHGVKTNDWGRFETSFMLATLGGGMEMADVPVCTQMPADAVNMECSCPAGGVDGAIWGADPYTADSDICTAARHAGILDAAGGVITVLRVQGLARYSSVELNGITSGEWIDYEASITFDWN